MAEKLRTDIYKIAAEVNGRKCCFTITELSYGFMSFKDYLYDSDGNVNGVVILCDEGHGYGFDYGEKEVELHVYDEYRFSHSFTDTSDIDWDDGDSTVKFKLYPYDEAPKLDCYGRATEEL